MCRSSKRRSWNSRKRKRKRRRRTNWGQISLKMSKCKMKRSMTTWRLMKSMSSWGTREMSQSFSMSSATASSLSSPISLMRNTSISACIFSSRGKFLSIRIWSKSCHVESLKKRSPLKYGASTWNRERTLESQDWSNAIWSICLRISNKWKWG